MSEGYGIDTHCGTSLRTGRLVTGIVALGLACLRRQITPRGILRFRREPVNYGIDLAEYVGRLGPELAANALPGIIRAELSKDDRVADVEVRITREELSPGQWRLKIEELISGHGESEQYGLTLGVSTDGVEVIASAVAA